MPEKDESYRAGRIDQELKTINGTLDRIGQKLDANFEWQRGVDARLTLGAEKSRTADKKIGEHDIDIEALKNKDRGVLAMASAIGGAIGAASAAAIKLFGG